MKISHNPDISCPYCRENVEEWLEKYLDIPIFKDSESRTFEEKWKYASSFKEENDIMMYLIIDNAETKTKETFFFAPKILEIIERDRNGKKFRDIHLTADPIRDVFLDNKKYRRICVHHYMINESAQNFSPQKTENIAKIRGTIEGNIFNCFCGIKCRKQHLNKHVLSSRHQRFMSFVVDRNFDKYAKMFDEYDLGY